MIHFQLFVSILTLIQRVFLDTFQIRFNEVIVTRLLKTSLSKFCFRWLLSSFWSLNLSHTKFMKENESEEEVYEFQALVTYKTFCLTYSYMVWSKWFSERIFSCVGTSQFLTMFIIFVFYLNNQVTLFIFKNFHTQNNIKFMQMKFRVPLLEAISLHLITFNSVKLQFPHLHF